MEFKKCLRCGSFFISSNNICCNCEHRDKLDILKLNNFIDDNMDIGSIEKLSINTGISTNNLNRFIQNDILPNFNIKK